MNFRFLRTGNLRRGLLFRFGRLFVLQSLSGFHFPETAVIFRFQILSVNHVIEHEAGLLLVQMPFGKDAQVKHFLEITRHKIFAFSRASCQILNLPVYSVVTELQITLRTF